MTGRSRSRGRSPEPMTPAMTNGLEVLANVPEDMIRDQLADAHKALQKMQGMQSARTPIGRSQRLRGSVAPAVRPTNLVY